MIEVIEQASFSEALDALMPDLQREYVRGVNRDLSQQRWQGVFDRQLTRVVKLLFSQCEMLLENCNQPLWCLSQIALQKKALVTFALQFNRSSCALSNFPDEHHPDAQYLTKVLLRIEQRWEIWSDKQLPRLYQNRQA